MVQFDFTRLDPRGRTARCPLPIGTETATGTLFMALTLKFAGDGNKGWVNATTKHTLKHNLNRRGIDPVELNRLVVQRDLDLYPQHVVVGWENVFDTAGEAVPFSHGACAEFLRAIPSWIFDEVRLFAITASNFTAPDQPSPSDVQDAAGN
jgi:hypothetical protein